MKTLEIDVAAIDRIKGQTGLDQFLVEDVDHMQLGIGDTGRAGRATYASLPRLVWLVRPGDQHWRAEGALVRSSELDVFACGIQTSKIKPAGIDTGTRAVG
jgi:hypothetical protein